MQVVAELMQMQVGEIQFQMPGEKQMPGEAADLQKKKPKHTKATLLHIAWELPPSLSEDV